MIKFFCLSLLTVASVFANASDSVLPSDTQLELGYHTGQFISIDRDYADIGVFSPLLVSQNLLSFVDAHAYHFNDGQWAASVGLGLRKAYNDGVFGVNTYYDYLRSNYKNDFNRFGLGLEWLHNCWDVRMNGYFAVGNQSQSSRFNTFYNLGDGFFATSHKKEYAYSGFDAELGIPLINYCDFNLYSAAGPYYYQRSHQNHFFGGYGRVELNWKSILSLEVLVSYDKPYSTRVQAIVQISIPLEFLSFTCIDSCKCSSLFTKPVQRNGIILTDHCCNWNWNWDDIN